MKYKYDTHVHTREASACASMGGADYIALYKGLGYHGIIITDHFFNGNTAVPKDLPWKDRVELFCSGYDNAKREGDAQDFSVFFGFEMRFDGDEYLIYGLDKSWLLAHPDIMSWSRREQFARVDAAGGLVVHAHPFRERSYIPRIMLAPCYVHAVEVANMGNPKEFDIRAYHYARHFSLPMTAGTDMHNEGMAAKRTLGMRFETPLSCIEDFIVRVKSGNGGLIAPRSRFAGKPDGEFGLKVKLLDGDGHALRPTYCSIFGENI